MVGYQKDGGGFILPQLRSHNQNNSIFVFLFPPYHHCIPPFKKSTFTLRKLVREIRWREWAWHKWRRRGILPVKPSRDQLYQLLHECSPCPCTLWASPINAHACEFVCSLDRNSITGGIFGMSNNRKYDLLTKNPKLELVSAAQNSQSSLTFRQKHLISLTNEQSCVAARTRKLHLILHISSCLGMCARVLCWWAVQTGPHLQLHLKLPDEGIDASKNRLDIHWMGIYIY